MKKILFVLFFCVSLGVFFTADSKSSTPVVNDGPVTAFLCFYTGSFADVCPYAGLNIIRCMPGVTSCAYFPPHTD